MVAVKARAAIPVKSSRSGDVRDVRFRRPKSNVALVGVQNPSAAAQAPVLAVRLKSK
jgi:hypothetical protein